MAAGALAGGLPLKAERATATDWVTLGRSGVKVTRLALGTGSFGGRIQQEIGQEGLTRLVHHAYDRGIRFFETAESYGASQQMLAVALKGIPRESYVLMSKVTTSEGVDPAAKLDELRQEFQHRLLRHYAAALAAHGDLGRGHDEVAGRDLEAEAEEADQEPRRESCTGCRRCG